MPLPDATLSRSGSAVREGFRLAQRPCLGVIDADMSHNPIVLPQLIKGLRDYDLTIGSRFGESSLVEQWAWHRKLISQVGVGAARLLTGVEDPLVGYFFLHRSVLGNRRMTCEVNKNLLGILIKGHYRNHHSLPIGFRNRQFSSSKLNWQEYLLFAKQLLYFGLREATGGSRPAARER